MLEETHGKLGESLEQNLERAWSKALEIIAALAKPRIRALGLFILGQRRQEGTGEHFSNTPLSHPLPNRLSMATEAGVKLQGDLRYRLLGETFAVRGVKHLIL